MTKPSTIMVVDVGKATEVELKELPNIGSARAKKIVQWRNEGKLTMEGLVTRTGVPQKEWARLYQEGAILLPLEESELIVPDSTPPSSPKVEEELGSPPSPRSILLQKQIQEMTRIHHETMLMRDADFEKYRLE